MKNVIRDTRDGKRGDGDLSRLAGHTGSEEWRRSRDSLLAAFAGGVTRLAVLSWLRSDTDGAHLPPEVRAMLDGSPPKAYVCSGTTCAAPVTTAAELRRTLQTFGVRNDVTVRLTR